MIITGIGSRETPPDVCQLFTELGKEAHERGWWVRSGHADGADYAFESGARENCIVYLPWWGFNKEKPLLGRGHAEPFRQEVFDMVVELQPYAKDLSKGVKLIKSRNVYQVLGVDLQTPSDVVVCWTPGGEITGGTGLAIQLAVDHNIPVVNVGDAQVRRGLDNVLRSIIEEVRA